MVPKSITSSPDAFLQFELCPIATNMQGSSLELLDLPHPF